VRNSKVNSDRLWATYHHIAKLEELGGDEQGSRWFQGEWGVPAASAHRIDSDTTNFMPLAEHKCGTSQCFAGWYVTLAGMPQDQWGRVKCGDGSVASVSQWVAADSGLGCSSAGDLFRGINDLGDIRRYLIRLTGEDRG
jgi:hypothetical protein